MSIRLHYAALCFLDCIVFPYGLGWSWHYEALCCIMPEYYFVRVPLASPNHVPYRTIPYCHTIPWYDDLLQYAATQRSYVCAPPICRLCSKSRKGGFCKGGGYNIYNKLQIIVNYYILLQFSMIAYCRNLLQIIAYYCIVLHIIAIFQAPPQNSKQPPR